jgi:prolyl-tRNA synthetase
MPTIQSAELWRQSGRYDAYGPEMLRFNDRKGTEMLYGPTNEEMITEIFLGAVKSYRELPRTLYHIQWKFRDEVRPRFGIMRGREFLMKDAYSFDLDEAGLTASYEAMFVAYLRTFARLGLQAVPVRAPTGPIGGNLSHEFHILAETGESAIFYDAALEDVSRDELLSADSATIARLTGLYAMEEEEHAKVADCPVPSERLRSRRGIEVGHIFAFGTKYSASMGLTVQGRDGGQVHPQMGSYGIGVSRLMGAIIEASHDSGGIVWPESVAPFRVGLVNMRSDDTTCAAAADEIYGKLQAAGIDTLYDDRDERGGAKFATMDLIGLPWQLIVGPKGIEKGVVELKKRATGEREELSLESALARLTA